MGVSHVLRLGLCFPPTKSYPTLLTHPQALASPNIRMPRTI